MLFRTPVKTLGERRPAAARDRPSVAVLAAAFFPFRSSFVLCIDESSGLKSDESVGGTPSADATVPGSLSAASGTRVSIPKLQASVLTKRECLAGHDFPTVFGRCSVWPQSGEVFRRRASDSTIEFAASRSVGIVAHFSGRVHAQHSGFGFRRENVGSLLRGGVGHECNLTGFVGSYAKEGCSSRAAFFGRRKK